MLQKIKTYLNWLARVNPAKVERTARVFPELTLDRLRTGDVHDDEVIAAIKACPEHFGVSKVSLPDIAFHQRLSHLLRDDFDDYTDTGRWTKLAADAGATVANPDGVDGLITLTTGAVDNNEAMLKSTRKSFLFANNKPCMADFRINYAEGATNAANVAVGFCSAFAADLLLDNGAGPAASFSGALIYKVDGGTVWKCVSSLGATQIISTSTAVAGGSVDQDLRIECQFLSATIVRITFFVDGAPLVDASQARPQPISHDLTYTSAALMGVGVYLKAGSGTSEVLNWDSIFAAQTRT